MKYDSDLVRFLILAPILPHLAILFVLFRKQLHKEVRWFVLYLATTVAYLPVLFVVYQLRDARSYFYLSWLFNSIGLVLAFMVILDVARNVLSGYAAIQRLALGFVATVGVALLSLATYVGTLGAPDQDPIMAFLLIFERSIRIVQIGLIVSLFAFVALLGLNWKNYVFGIALGYGLYASASLSLIAYVAQVGPKVAYISIIIDQFAYLSMLAIWMTYVLQTEPAKRVLFPASARQDLERWNRALAEVVSR
jgi:hypothetical protein